MRDGSVGKVRRKQSLSSNPLPFISRAQRCASNIPALGMWVWRQEGSWRSLANQSNWMDELQVQWETFSQQVRPGRCLLRQACLLPGHNTGVWFWCPSCRRRKLTPASFVLWSAHTHLRTGLLIQLVSMVRSGYSLSSSVELTSTSMVYCFSWRWSEDYSFISLLSLSTDLWDRSLSGM